jgi:multiple sugar transport system substrate-binding protein
MPSRLLLSRVRPAVSPVWRRAVGWLRGLGGSTFLMLGVLIAPASPAEAAAPPPVELSMWVMPVTLNAQHDVSALLKPWLDRHPGVHVRITVLDWESGWNKITAAAASRRGPDLLELGTTWMPAIAAMGGLEPLTPAQVESAGGAAAYYGELWKTCGVLGQPGVYGLPWYADVRAAYYRTDVFRAAGVDPAQAFSSWPAFRAALEKVNGIHAGGKRVAALAYAGKNDWNVVHNLAPWVWNAGGDLLTADGRHSALGAPAAVRAIDFYTHLAVDGLVPPSALEKDSDILEGAFVAGDYAVIFSGSWLIRRIFEAPPGSWVQTRFDVAPYPPGDHGQWTFFGGSNLAIFKGSRHKAEAWSALQYLGSREAQVQLALLSSMMPTRPDAAADPRLAARHPAYAKLAALETQGRAYPPIPAWGPLETVYTKHLGAIAELASGATGPFSEPALQQLIATTVAEADKVLKEADQ